MFFGLLQPDVGTLKRQSDRIEKKLDLILTHLGIPWGDETQEHIQELLRAGRKIDAIKFYREQSGASLKDAKDFVESLE